MITLVGNNIYLTDGDQHVHLKTQFQLHGILRIIHQRSLVGSLLFNIVINNLNTATKNRYNYVCRRYYIKWKCVLNGPSLL